MKPFLKWTGGKQRIAAPVSDSFGPCRGDWIEPFCGSGAVFFHRSSYISRAVLSDSNARLIGTHKAVRDDVEAVIGAMGAFPTEEGWKERYNDLREDFRAIDESDYTEPEAAALFIWINRACFNGMYRENSKGVFNIPKGSYRTVSLPDPDHLRAASTALAKATLMASDFGNVLTIADEGDQVYCDPPYVPKDATASFTAYTKGGFDHEQQIRLAQLARQASQRGVTVGLSNRDLPVVRDLYEGAEITQLAVNHSVGASSRSRKKVGELLAMFRSTQST